MRIALGVEYDGSRYFGWQRQQEVPSVQEALEKALSRIAAQPIQVVCAGRTDAGVHATGQVVHFDTTVDRVDQAWTQGCNTMLPADIGVRWVQHVDDNFSARFSAVARRYRYIIYNHSLRPAILGAGVTHIYAPLDAGGMHEAAQVLVGEHDFTSFRASHCQSNTPFRDIHHIDVKRYGHYIVVDIQANAFVHHMVRNIVGSLVVIGRDEQPVRWMAEILQARDRTLAAATAKPHGLYLVDVLYPDALRIPRSPLGPLWLNDVLA
ncbi:tRNA pseudouridine(38-40) synthase TruA [Aliidiomarina halalkaliphila]|uniref:tRNA pseudouridine synthase A n=1 Tax=Aliidiomarina halalkaliphila TaxID=2593535 RepID=A0A552X2X7_9GAMM|nr:tRNA pseudouridine(38-40) synthase TruA [Aliidiomarina halalkaliphila]TRW49335.1 tRNA pseudouridine(38-40) synthase TruA [Aliidiomarina halalkaliphila]